MNQPQQTASQPYLHSSDDVLLALATSPGGLSSEDVVRRLAEHGPNKIGSEKHLSPWPVLLSQFKNVLIIILLFATAISAVLGHGIEAIAITVIILFSIVLGFIQEFRAERALEALNRLTAPIATVIRDGVEIEVAAAELVPGDIIRLGAGDVVPADARLITAKNLKVQESALTGESGGINKHTDPVVGENISIGDRRNMVFAGTIVSIGRGHAVVTSTGMKTEFGRIALLLENVDRTRTPLQQNLDALGRTLGKIALFVVAVVVALALVRGQDLLETLIFGIALAVAVVPEALPAVVTISLALGVQRLVKRRALMRRLSAVETLGSTTVICSDKTGTLTKDEMTVRAIVVANQRTEVTGSGYTPDGSFQIDGVIVAPSELLLLTLTAASLASDATMEKGDPTERALVVAALKAGLAKANLEAEFPRVQEVPFSSETKRMTTVHAVGDEFVVYAKGAPEVIMQSCTHEHNGTDIIELSDQRKTEITKSATILAAQALRVIAVASKSTSSTAGIEQGLVLLGLIGMIDPPREEVAASLRKCESAGIRVLMITGDHPVTALAVARELGVIRTENLVTGSQLEVMSDADLHTALQHTDVFARVAPIHKLRIVESLQRDGAVVAMTGDGVNDAPALQKADIGIAMGITGTDVAKEAAAMMLTDDNFASIVAAIEEGRGIFSNIKKYLMFLLSSNIGEIGVMAGAAALGMPLPLTAVQLLYINLATDGLPAVSLAVDPPEPGLMEQKPRKSRKGIFTKRVVGLMSIGGVWSMLVNLGIFTWATSVGKSYAEAVTMTFVSLILIQFFKAYSFRSDRVSTFRKPFANKWLNLAIAWELVMLLFVVYLPVLHEPFGTFSLSLNDWLIVGGAAVSILPVLEIAKRVWK